MSSPSPDHTDPSRPAVPTRPPDQAEWLEADGLGGFASGTASGIRTRRYHALLLAATNPPTGRMTLVQGVEAWLDGPRGRVGLTRQAYVGGTVTGCDGAVVESFTHRPWPTWRLRVPGGGTITHEVFVPRGRACVVLTWRADAIEPGTVLKVRPLLSGRDYHALHRENAGFRFDADTGLGPARVHWSPYPGVPAIEAWHNARYSHATDWYRNFDLREELSRGFEHAEDLATPGAFEFDPASGECVLVMGIAGALDDLSPGSTKPHDAVAGLRDRERARRARPALEVSGDAYIVARAGSSTIIAGYPWFADWGRDSMIAVRGLCIATGRLALARDILLAWARALDGGLLPNRFPDDPGEAPEYNSVDAALWFVVAARELIDAAAETDPSCVSAGDVLALRGAILDIVRHYAAGTRHGIAMDPGDSLLRCGEANSNLTWMDARVHGRAVTPRVGKPVEVQALWIHALEVAGGLDGAWLPHARRAREAFARLFWNPGANCLYDVIDADHVPGRTDASIRPNQVYALGGLPITLVEGERARAMFDTITRELATPAGLRSLSPRDPAYRGRYEGDAASRDGAYHQGTAWAFLAGAYAEAFVRVHGSSPEARRAARETVLDPLLATGNVAGMGHVPEIADADRPHAARGCPFQAWSVGEALRLDRVVLRDEPQPPAAPPLGARPAGTSDTRALDQPGSRAGTTAARRARGIAR